MTDTARGTEAEPGGNGSERPSEDELRQAYEAELQRISSTDVMLQTAASLLNVGAYRLGLIGGERSERDLDQVRDAIDGVRALLPILERKGDANQLRPLRDALSQLQLAYARELQADAAQPAAGDADAGAPHESPADPDTGAAPAGGDRAEPAEDAAQAAAGEGRRPGPAEASGRLWVPGKG
jgi:hypothetical protein